MMVRKQIILATLIAIAGTYAKAGTGQPDNQMVVANVSNDTNKSESNSKMQPVNSSTEQEGFLKKFWENLFKKPVKLAKPVMSDEGKEKIEAVLKQLNVDPKKIKLVNSQYTIAAAMLQRWLIINPKFFSVLYTNVEGDPDLQLTEEECLAIIGHEGIHFKDYHVPKAIALFYGLAYGLPPVINGIVKDHKSSLRKHLLALNDLGMSPQMLYELMVYLPILALGNYHERMADLKSVEKLKSHDALISAFKKIKQYIKIKKSKQWLITRLLLLPIELINKIMDPHPSLDKRIKYIEKSKKKMEKTESLGLVTA